MQVTKFVCAWWFLWKLWIIFQQIIRSLYSYFRLIWAILFSAQAIFTESYRYGIAILPKYDIFWCVIVLLLAQKYHACIRRKICPRWKIKSGTLFVNLNNNCEIAHRWLLYSTNDIAVDFKISTRHTAPRARTIFNTENNSCKTDSYTRYTSDTYADNTRAQYRGSLGNPKKNVSTAAFNHRLKADKGTPYFSLALLLSPCKNRANREHRTVSERTSIN